MQVTEHSPSPRLAPFVAKLVILETREAVSRVPLGDPAISLGIRYAGAASLLERGPSGGASVDAAERGPLRRLPAATVTGILPAARRIRTEAQSGMVLAQLRPAGAAALLRVPLDELLGATVALDELFDRAAVAEVSERVTSARSPAQRLAAFEAFLLRRLRPDAIDPLASAAVDALAARRGDVRIAELSRTLGISQDPLEKRFRRAVGTSPKHLASLLRLGHSIELGQRGARWTVAAHRAGYFDQSHFIREFRAFTGETPSRFFRSGEHC